jgi:hypothetical protein
VGAVVLDDAAHANRGGALEERVGDDGVGARHGIASAGDGEDAVVDALDDLADAGLDARLVPQVGDILSALADDDAGLLGGDDSAKGELGLGVLLVRPRGGLAIGAEAGLAVFELKLVQRVEDVAAVGGEGVLGGGHGDGW